MRRPSASSSAPANDHLGRDAAEVGALAADQARIDAEHRPAGRGHVLGHLATAWTHPEDDQVEFRAQSQLMALTVGKDRPVNQTPSPTDERADRPATVYEAVGGEATFTRLVDAFYAGVAADPVLRAIYPEDDLGPAAERLRLFLIQYWGGPTTYSDQRGHPRLRMRHVPFAVSVAARDAWLRHMRRRARLDSTCRRPTTRPCGVISPARRTACATSPAEHRHNQPGARSDAAATLTHPGGATPSSTRSTRAASATGTATATGDLIGLRLGLPYLAELGVDALWLSPFYRSPMADGGYDVSDPCDVDPIFGTLADFDALVASHARPRPADHRSTSSRTTSPTGTRGSRRRWPPRPAAPNGTCSSSATGRGPGGDAAAEQLAVAVRRLGLATGRRCRRHPGQWYLHLFAPEQPDLNWTNPAVPAEFARILRFWLDRGVDGFRVDVAHGMAKPPGLPDMDLIGWSGRPSDPHARQGPALGSGRRPRVPARIPGGDRLLPRRPDGRRRGLGARRRPAGAVRPPGRAQSDLQLQPARNRLGRGRVRQGDQVVAARDGRASARPAPGCCPTTTSSGTSPATAAAPSAWPGPGRRR